MQKCAVAQQFALVRADADSEIAPRRDCVLAPDAIAGQVIELGPLAHGVGLFPVEILVIPGQRRDTFAELRAHIDRDGVVDRLCVERAHQLVLVQRAVAAQINLVEAAGQRSAQRQPSRFATVPAGYGAAIG
jgi:hypothetical protein